MSTPLEQDKTVACIKHFDGLYRDPASCNEKYLNFGAKLAQTVILLKFVNGLRIAQRSAGKWANDQATKTVFNLWFTAVTQHPTLYSLAYSFVAVAIPKNLPPVHTQSSIYTGLFVFADPNIYLNLPRFPCIK